MGSTFVDMMFFDEKTYSFTYLLHYYYDPSQISEAGLSEQKLLNQATSTHVRENTGKSDISIFFVKLNRH